MKHREKDSTLTFQRASDNSSPRGKSAVRCSALWSCFCGAGQAVVLTLTTRLSERARSSARVRPVAGSGRRDITRLCCFTPPTLTLSYGDAILCSIDPFQASNAKRGEGSALVVKFLGSGARVQSLLVLSPRRQDSAADVKRERVNP